MATTRGTSTSRVPAAAGSDTKDVPRLVPLVLASSASQALLVVLTPSIAAVADDLGVSVTMVGQARTLTAAVALVTALGLLMAVSTLGVRWIAVGGVLTALLACAAVASATGVVTYLAAHVVVGLAVAALLTAGFAGMAAFTGAARAWAAGWVTAAGGSAWVVGTPVVGLLTEHVSWRATHAFPAVLALGLLAVARRCPGPVPGVRRGALGILASTPSARRWAVAEALANVGWTSVLTYVGALLVVGLGISEGRTGWLLSFGAACFVVASVAGGRLAAGRDVRALSVVCACAVAVAVLLLFGAVLVPVGATLAGAVAFALTATVGGLRIPVMSVLGMAQLPGRPDVMMAARVASMQVGYLVGAAVTGWVVATAGWAAVGPVLGGVLVASALVTRGLRPVADA